MCSLPCGLGRIVGGKVQMGPCSPSSASPSLREGGVRHGEGGPNRLAAASQCPGLHVGVLRAGLPAMALGLPTLVAVDELGKEGCLLCIARDELVLQKLPSCGPLWVGIGAQGAQWARARLWGRPSHPELTNRGSLLRQASTNSLKGLLWWPSSVGGLFLGMRNRTRMGCRSELGGSPLASSMAVMPSDQISA